MADLSIFDKIIAESQEFKPKKESGKQILEVKKLSKTIVTALAITVLGKKLVEKYGKPLVRRDF